MKKMIPIGESPRVSKLTVLLCAVAAVLAVAVSLTSVLSYSRSVRENRQLLSEVKDLTARYNDIVDDNKLLSAEYEDLETMGKAVNSDADSIHKSEKTLEDAAKFNKESESLKIEIGELKTQLEELKSQFPEGYFEMDEEE